MPTVELRLSVRQEIRQAISQAGRSMPVPVCSVWRNDAAVLYDVLSACDTAKERFRDRRRMIAALMRLLSPKVKAASARAEGELLDELVGSIEVSREALEFLHKLFSDPPEGVQLRGDTVETALMIEDLMDEIKKADKAASSAEPAAVPPAKE